MVQRAGKVREGFSAARERDHTRSGNFLKRRIVVKCFTRRDYPVWLKATRAGK
jgi:hypothetical protein